MFQSLLRIALVVFFGFNIAEAVVAQRNSNAWHLRDQGNGLCNFVIDSAFTFEALVKSNQVNTGVNPNPIYHSQSSTNDFNFSLEEVEATVQTAQGPQTLRFSTRLTPQVGQWYHYAVTYDGFYLRAYIDGCLMDSAFARGIVQYSGQLLIGQNDNNFSSPRFTGELDEMRFWTVARTQQELINNMNNELNFAAEGNLFGYINLEGTNPNRIAEIPNRTTFFVCLTGGANTTEPSVIFNPEVFVLDSLVLKPLSCKIQNDASARFFTSFSQYSAALNNQTPVSMKNEFDSITAGNYTLRIELPTGCIVRRPFRIDSRRRLTSVPSFTSSGCYGDTLLLFAGVTDSVVVDWQEPQLTAAGYSAFTIHDSLPNVYSFRVSHLECDTTYTLTVPGGFTVKPSLSVSDTCLDALLELCVSSPAFASAQWMDGRTRPCIDVRTTGLWQCEITDTTGCSAVVETIVRECNPQVFIPNAFTPDGDGINDRFEVVDHQGLVLSMRVWDRWGNELISRDEAPWAWDGTAKNQTMALGMYAVQVRYVDQQGKTKTHFGLVRLLP
ncbi:MAG TPA: LamG-like jellyroll fold domain-containing protein [Luteibaculaceae bacterium]|nr:LamG-like jellyroll fold domain-containing protein [Luteibaculaceae bacterium]